MSVRCHRFSVRNLWFFDRKAIVQKTLALGRCFSTCITTGWMDGIFTRGKLFSSSSSSFPYLLAERSKTQHNSIKAASSAEIVAQNHNQPLTHLSSSLPSAITATLSISFSRSSSKTDWWNSSRGVPWRSRKGRADWRVGSRMPFSICSHSTSLVVNF